MKRVLDQMLWILIQHFSFYTLDLDGISTVTDLT